MYKFDLAVYGHITIDRIINNFEEEVSLGAIANFWNALNIINSKINESNEIYRNLSISCSEDICNASDLMLKSIAAGKKIIWCGNGGSAADAQHMAAELMGGLTSHDRKPIESIALTTDSSFITAWANDTSYDTIFSRQLEAVGKENDVLVAISTSGNSKNVIEALEVASVNNIKKVVLTGEDGGLMADKGDVTIKVPSTDTQRIQESHILIEHILCEIIENYVINNDI